MLTIKEGLLYSLLFDGLVLFFSAHLWMADSNYFIVLLPMILFINAVAMMCFVSEGKQNKPITEFEKRIADLEFDKKYYNSLKGE